MSGSISSPRAASPWLSLLAAAWRWMESWRSPPDPVRSAGFLEAQRWTWEYSPKRDGDEYALALEYAQKRYEEITGLFELLNKKLDDLARTSLAIGVIVATMARVFGSNSPLGHSPLLLWAVVFFALSVLVAVWSRGPTISGTPLEIRDLLKVMDDQTDLSKARLQAVLASSYYLAVVRTYATNNWKAVQLWRATSLLLIGVVLLVGMLVTAAP